MKDHTLRKSMGMVLSISLWCMNRMNRNFYLSLLTQSPGVLIPDTWDWINHNFYIRIQLQMHIWIWMILKCHRNHDCNDYRLVRTRLAQHNSYWHFICYINIWALKRENDLQEFSQNVEAYCYKVEINNNFLKIYPFYLL